MCIHCRSDALFGDMFYSRGMGLGFGFDDSVGYESFNAVSDRAMEAGSKAERIFLDHLATVDVSKGPVTTEIIHFHLVQAMTTQFRKVVKDHGCTMSQRKLTRDEQNLINKSRKSLMNRTSVTVSAAAQKKYIDAHPEAAARARQQHEARANATHNTSAKAPLGSLNINMPLPSSSSMQVGSSKSATGTKRAAEESFEGPMKKRQSI